MSQTEISKPKPGDFVRHKQSEDKSELTYLLVAVSDQEEQTRKPYKLEHYLGTKKDVPGSTVFLASEEQKRSWISSRKSQLSQVSSIEVFVERCLKHIQPPQMLLGHLRSILTRNIDLSPEEESELDCHLKQALNGGGKIQYHEVSELVSLIIETRTDVSPATVLESKPHPVKSDAPAKQEQKPSKKRPGASQKMPAAEKDAGLAKQPESVTPQPDTLDEQNAVSHQKSVSADENVPPEAALLDAIETIIPVPGSTEETALATSPPADAGDLTEAAPTKPTPKEIAEELTAKWENLGNGPMEAERAELAGKMQTFWDAPKKPDAIKAVIEFIELYETDQEKPQPVFWVLSSSDNALMQRELITRLDLGTLINYVEWLIQRPSHSKSQVEGILNGLTGKFQAATREGGINHYQRIAQAMGDLLKGLDPETRGPYEWRLFSFLREGWARLAPHARAGNNDLIGAQNYLKWVLERKQLWPETIWDALLSSLMRDEAISRLEAGVRRRILECAATHVLATPKGQIRTRLLHFQEALTEQMLIEFMIEIGKEATRQA